MKIKENLKKEYKFRGKLVNKIHSEHHIGAIGCTLREYYPFELDEEVEITIRKLKK